MDIKEKKPQPPKNSTLFYCVLVLVILLILNIFVMPSLAERSIKDATYDAFLNDLEAGKISEVNLEEDVIYYLEEGNGRAQVYKTGYISSDVDLVERLDEAGVVFNKEVPQTMSPIVSFLISWLLPFVIIWFLGGWLMKKLMKIWETWEAVPVPCLSERAMPRFM